MIGQTLQLLHLSKSILCFFSKQLMGQKKREIYAWLIDLVYFWT